MRIQLQLLACTLLITLGLAGAVAAKVALESPFHQSSLESVLLSPPIAASECYTVYRTYLDLWLCVSSRGGSILLSNDLGLSWQPITLPDEFVLSADNGNQWPLQFQISQQSPLSSTFYLVRRDITNLQPSNMDDPSSIWKMQLDATLVNCSTTTNSSSGNDNSRHPRLFPSLALFTPMPFQLTVAASLNITAFPYLRTIGAQSVATDPSGHLLMLTVGACADVYEWKCIAGRMVSDDGYNWHWGPVVTEIATASSMSSYGIGWTAAVNESGIITSSGVFVHQLCNTATNNPWVVVNCSLFATESAHGGWSTADPTAWTNVWSVNKSTPSGASFLEPGAPTLLLTATSVILLRTTDYAWQQAPFTIRPTGFVTSGRQLLQSVVVPGISPSQAQIWSSVMGPQLLSPANGCAFFPMQAVESVSIIEADIDADNVASQDDLMTSLIASSTGVSVAWGNDCGAVPNGAFVCRHNWTLASAGQTTLDQWQCAIVNTSSSAQGLYASGFTQSVSLPRVELMAGGTVMWRSNNTNIVTNPNNGNSSFAVNAFNAPASAFLQFTSAVLVSAVATPLPNSTVAYMQSWAFINVDGPIGSAALLDYHSAPSSNDWNDTLNQALPFFACLPVYHNTLQALFAVSVSRSPSVNTLQASYDGINYMPVQTSLNFQNQDAGSLNAVYDVSHPDLAPILALIQGSYSGGILFLGDASVPTPVPVPPTIRNASQIFVNWTRAPLTLSVAMYPLPTVARRDHTIMVAMSSTQSSYYPAAFSNAMLYRGLIDPLSSTPGASVKWQLQQQQTSNLTLLGCDVKYRTDSVYPRRWNDASLSLAASPSVFFLACPSLGSQPQQTNTGARPDGGLSQAATVAKWLVSTDGISWTGIYPVGAPTIANVSASGARSWNQNFDANALPLPSAVVYSTFLQSFLLSIGSQVWLCSVNMDWCRVVWVNPFNAPLTAMQPTEDGMLVGSFDAFVQFVPLSPSIANQTDAAAASSPTVAQLEPMPTVCSNAAAQVGPGPDPPQPPSPPVPPVEPEKSSNGRAAAAAVIVVIVLLCVALGCWYAHKRGAFESLRRSIGLSSTRIGTNSRGGGGSVGIGVNSSSDGNELNTRFVPMVEQIE